jgi:hypothetical protein
MLAMVVNCDVRIRFVIAMKPSCIPDKYCDKKALEIVKFIRDGNIFVSSNELATSSVYSTISYKITE